MQLVGEGMNTDAILDTAVSAVKHFVLQFQPLGVDVFRAACGRWLRYDNGDSL